MKKSLIIIVGTVFAIFGLNIATTTVNAQGAFTTVDSIRKDLSFNDLETYSVFDLKLGLKGNILLEPKDSITRHSSANGSGDDIKYAPPSISFINPEIQVMAIEVVKKETVLLCRLRENGKELYFKFSASNDAQANMEFLMNKDEKEASFNFGVPYKVVGGSVSLTFVVRTLIEK